MNPLSLLSSLFSAIAGIFGYVKTVQEEKNSPAMQAGKTAEGDSKEADKITKLVARANAGDKAAEAELRRLNSEV